MKKSIKELPRFFLDLDDVIDDTFRIYEAMMFEEKKLETVPILPLKVRMEILQWGINRDNIMEKIPNLLNRINWSTARTDGKNEEERLELEAYYTIINQDFTGQGNIYKEVESGISIYRNKFWEETLELLSEDGISYDTYVYYITEVMKIFDEGNSLEEEEPSYFIKDLLRDLYSVINEQEHKKQIQKKEKNIFRKIFGNTIYEDNDASNNLRKKEPYKKKALKKFKKVLEAYFHSESSVYNLILTVEEFSKPAPFEEYSFFDENDFFEIMDFTERFIMENREEEYGDEEKDLFLTIFTNAVSTGLISKEEHIDYFLDLLKTDSERLKLIGILEDKKNDDGSYTYTDEYISTVIDELVEEGGYGKAFMKKALQYADENYNKKKMHRLFENAKFSFFESDKYGDSDKVDIIRFLEVNKKSEKFINEVLLEFIENSNYGAYFLRFLNVEHNGLLLENADMALYNAQLSADECEEFIHFPMKTDTREKLIEIIYEENPKRAEELCKQFSNNGRIRRFKDGLQDFEPNNNNGIKIEFKDGKLYVNGEERTSGDNKGGVTPDDN